MAKRKWSDLPVWVRAKIVKNRQSPGKTVLITPDEKLIPMSEADEMKENRKSQELRNMQAAYKTRASFLDHMSEAAFALFQSQQEKTWSENAERRRNGRTLSCKIGKGKI